MSSRKALNVAAIYHPEMSYPLVYVVDQVGKAWEFIPSRRVWQALPELPELTEAEADELGPYEGEGL